MSTDPYTMLGVAETATPDEIKRAYRRLARRYHPDGDAGDAQAFREVRDAYELLSDSERRNAYDASRRPARKATAASRARGPRGGAVDITVDVGGVVENVVAGVVDGLGGLLGKRKPRR